jgi:acetylornithine/succinyldiaminopimelate/putrescine aminotransferase
MPGVRFCPWGDLDALRALVGSETAAVIVEPVQGESGVRPASPEFLRGILEICRERGALLVADEIQTGLGRTGKMFAYEHAGVTPDILTLAKPLGGGLPLGAVLLRDGLADAIVPGDHGSTFGGNPVAAAASLTVLDRLETPGFLAEVESKGRKLRTRLEKLARRFNQVVEVRGLGLMLGMEFKGSATPVVAGLRERGFLAVKAGDRVLRMLPPFIIPQSEIKRFSEALEEILVGGAGSAA